MLQINETIIIPDGELEYTAIRSQGAGGQHVNKTSTAIQLRFDIQASSLPEDIKTKLMDSGDHHISRDGIIIIKAQEYRSQVRNRLAACDRLKVIINEACQTQKKRVKTQVPVSVNKKRLQDKARRADTKRLRGNIKDYD